MRQVIRQAMVPQSPAEMYSLVNDIARYPEFVPYCLGAQVLSQSPTSLSAVLTVGRSGVKVSIGTQNTMQINEFIELKLLSGPFKSFHGEWRFTPITAFHETVGEPKLLGTRVDLKVAFEFESALLDVVAGRLFESTWNTLVDTFVARAREKFPRFGALSP